MKVPDQTQKAKAIPTIEFISLMACIMLLTALAIDIMLPAFTAIRQQFGLGKESTETARLVTFFFLGQLGQLAFGPMADRYGRLLVLRLGFLLYISACITTVLVTDFSALLIARFVTGLGSSAMFVSAIACVRDRFKGDAMAKTMSLIMTIFLIVPVVAPLLGAMILRFTSWQIVFLTPPFFALIFFLWSLRLPESMPDNTDTVSGGASLIKAIREVFSNSTFVRYSAMTTILFGAFSSYVGSSERIIGTIYQQPQLFVFIFGAIGASMALFTFLNARIVARLGAHQTLRILLGCYFAMAGLLFVMVFFWEEKPNIFVLFSLIGLLQSINLAIEPNSSALALEPMGERAGMAASIYGTSYLVVGASVGSLIDSLLVDSVKPLAIAYVVGGGLAFMLGFLRKK